MSLDIGFRSCLLTFLSHFSIMKQYILPAFVLCAVLSIFGISANGQKKAESKQNGAITQVANFAGQVTVVIVKSAGKAAWETTKFTAKDIAKPIILGIAKPLLLKAAPKLSMFALKLTGNALKKGIPFAGKLGLAYLKAKLPI